MGQHHELFLLTLYFLAAGLLLPLGRSIVDPGGAAEIAWMLTVLGFVFGIPLLNRFAIQPIRPHWTDRISEWHIWVCGWLVLIGFASAIWIVLSRWAR